LKRRLQSDLRAMEELTLLLNKYKRLLCVRFDYNDSIMGSWHCDIYMNIRQYCHGWSGEGKTLSTAIKRACRKVEVKLINKFLEEITPV